MWSGAVTNDSSRAAGEDYALLAPCWPANATATNGQRGGFSDCFGGGGGGGGGNVTSDEPQPSDLETSVTDIYQSWAPVMIFFCALTFVFNVFIVVAARWMRRPLTSTMFFSLSLAAADAVASLTVGLGLVFHSLLPKVYNIYIPKWSPCTMLVLEAVRLGAVIVTVVHLLALAVNHYIGIARPLHYAAIMTKRTATICIVLMWIGPNAALFAYFSSIEDQGFRSQECATDFIVRLHFRGQYASFFFAPLFIMILIYGHIFVIIRQHQANRRAMTQHVATRPSSSVVIGVDNAAPSVVGERSFNNRVPRNGRQGSVTSARRLPHYTGTKFRSHQRGNFNNSSMTSARDGSDHSSNAVSRNVKAVITTLLIVGTFILGWIPAVVWFIIYCEDCIIPFGTLPLTVTLPIGITVNSLIVLKSFLDPIIYTARMKDFKIAFGRMRYQLVTKCCPRRCWRGNSNGAGEDEATMVHFNRSLFAANNSVTACAANQAVHPCRSLRFNAAPTTTTAVDKTNLQIGSNPAEALINPDGQECTDILVATDHSDDNRLGC